MPRLSAETKTAIVAAYRDDRPAREIIAEFGISKTALYAALREHGIEPDNRSKRRRDWTQPEMDRIAEMRAAGAPMTEIAAAMGASSQAVRIALDALDLAGRQHRPTSDLPARIVRPDGRALVRVADDDPMRVMANPAGLVPEARLVAARVLERPLEPDERVLHRNGDRLDCRPENLIVKRR